jgi:hypothetical protein
VKERKKIINKKRVFPICSIIGEDNLLQSLRVNGGFVYDFTSKLVNKKKVVLEEKA